MRGGEECLLLLLLLFSVNQLEEPVEFEQLDLETFEQVQLFHLKVTWMDENLHRQLEEHLQRQLVLLRLTAKTSR